METHAEETNFSVNRPRMSYLRLIGAQSENGTIPQPESFPNTLDLDTVSSDYYRNLLRLSLSQKREVLGSIDAKDNGELQVNPLSVHGTKRIFPIGQIARAYYRSPSLQIVHSHLDEPAYASPGDLHIMKKFNSSAYIFGITSITNTLLLCQTEKSLAIPFSGIIDGIKFSKMAKRTLADAAYWEYYELGHVDKDARREAILEEYQKRVREVYVQGGYVGYEVEGNILQKDGNLKFSRTT